MKRFFETKAQGPMKMKTIPVRELTSSAWRTKKGGTYVPAGFSEMHSSAAWLSWPFPGGRSMALRRRFSPVLPVRLSGNHDRSSEFGFRPMTLRHRVFPVLPLSVSLAILVLIRIL